MNFYKIIITSLIFVFVALSVNAQDVKTQKIITNSKGEKILLKEDGTFEVIKEKKEKKKKEKSPKKTKTKKSPKPPKNKAQKQEDDKKKKSSKPKKVKAPKTKTPKTKTPKVKVSKEEQARLDALERERKLAALKAQKNKATGQPTEATKTVQTESGIKTVPTDNTNLPVTSPITPASEMITAESSVTPSNCELAQNEIDPFSGLMRKTTTKEALFSFTPTSMAKFFPTGEYMTCEGSMTKRGKEYFLNFDINIASIDAVDEYGQIESESLLQLILLDESTLKLFALDNAKVTFDLEGKTTLYQVSYQISKDQIKLLLKSEPNQFRLVWSSGYEDYDCYNLDFFTKWLSCIQ